MTQLLRLTVSIAALGAASYAESTLELLERGIYAEEARGDLPAAIRAYSHVATMAGAERTARAQALFRLGMCHLKSGDPAAAQKTFGKLTKEYPEQQHLLNGIPGRGAKPLPLQAAPWGADEVLTLQASSGSFVVYRSKEERRDGRAMARLETYWRWNFAGLDADSDTLKPLQSVFEGFLSTVREDAAYSSSGARVVRRDERGMTTRHIHAPAAAYDSMQLVHLIRRLPLADGYAATIPVVSLAKGAVDIKVEVLGREEVTVPAGSFTTYKVKQIDRNSTRPANITWYSADLHQYPVKTQYPDRAQMDDWELKLVEIRRELEARRVSVRDSQLAVSFELPTGWILAGAMSEPAATARMLAPGMKAVGGVRRVLPGTYLGWNALKTPADLAAFHIEDLLAKGSASTVRGDGPVDVEVNGVKAVRVVADDPRLTHDWVFFVHNGQRVALWFDVQTSRWDELKPVFDALIASVRFE